MMREKVISRRTRGRSQNNSRIGITRKIFPFLKWFDDFSFQNVKSDLISGVTVALVLIPQSMAYAQLADLPAYYGLYAAFLPPLISALFGSSNQLATGPVAIVSLMTATALAPLATAGSEAFIAYAILLALMVGLFQFLLGVLKLGLIVNFLSHPVVNGFTNAAALIIATSQLSKIFGVEVDRYEHHYETVYHVFEAALKSTHWPALLLAVLAFAVMIILKKINPKIPNVLIAVVVTILLSYFLKFENNNLIDSDSIYSAEFTGSLERFNHHYAVMDSAVEKRVEISGLLRAAEAEFGEYSEEVIELEYQLTKADWKINEQKEEIHHLRPELREFRFAKILNESGDYIFVPRDELSGDQKTFGKNWRLKVKNESLDIDKILLIGGGAVVGNIPQGLPAFTRPKIDFQVLPDLFSMAIIISLLGFMEAISIAKAMAAKTGQRLDPNQELIGQGLANIAGSLFQSYPVSGSFSRSAVNIQSGAVTGLSNVFSSLVVMATLLFFTPLLYYLPQSVLASIIMMAVIGLINIKGFVHAYQAQKYDGIIALISFAGTLVFAPHLDKGIMIGVVLSVGHFLFRNIKPDMAILSKYVDGTYRSADRRQLQRCKHIAVVRFNNSLFFANTNYLEEEILELLSTMPELRHIHVVCNGINELDATGEATLSMLITRLRENNVEISLSGINENVMDVMMRTHLTGTLGDKNIYGNVAMAVYDLYNSTHRDTTEEKCPLLEAMTMGLAISDEYVSAFKKERWNKPASRFKLKNKNSKLPDDDTGED